MKNAILLGVGLIDNVSKDLNSIAKRMRGHGRTLASVGAEMTNAFTIPIVAAGAAVLKFTADLSALKAGLTAAMGSAEAAEKELKLLKKSAELPGMGFMSAVKGSTNLQALGASAESARYMMEGLAKAVAYGGGGDVEFGRVMDQFIQLAGRGKLLQEDLKFMFQTAPKLRGVVAKIFGTSSPEELRKITTASEFVDKVIRALHDLPPVGDNAKTALENFWTSLNVGAGEVGSAILNTQNWDEALMKLSSTVDRVAETLVEFIKNNRTLTKTILISFAALASVGPLTRFIGNIKMLSSYLIKLPALLMAAAKAMNVFSVSTKRAALARAGWVGAMVAGAQFVPTDTDNMRGFDRRWESGKTPGWLLQGEAFGKMLASTLKLNAVEAMDWSVRWIEGGQLGLGKYAPASNRSGLAGRYAALRERESERKSELEFAGFIKDALGGGDGGAGKEFEWDGKPIWSDISKDPITGEDMASSLVDRLKPWADLEKKLAEIDFAEQLGATELDVLSDKLAAVRDGLQTTFLAYGATDAFTTEFQGMYDELKSQHDDLKLKLERENIWENYQKQLREVALAERLGASDKEILADKISAVRTALSQANEQFGFEHDLTKQLLGIYDGLKAQYDELLGKEEALAAAKEKTNEMVKAMNTSLGIAEEAFSALFEGGKKGMEGFVKAIGRAVTATIRLALAQYIAKNVATLGIGGAIAVGALGGLFLASIESLLGKVSMAEGGIITGETLLRAGEYPGVGANPEVIAPLNKLKEHIQDAVGGGGGNIQGVIRGRDIHLVTTMQERLSRRIGGPQISFG